jgi:glycerate 2-kinase
MIPAQSFWTHSLRISPWGDSITRIMAEAIRAVDPGLAVKNTLKINGDLLTVEGRDYKLSSYEHIHLLGVGKASPGMSLALSDVIGSYLSDGLIITKQLPGFIKPPISVVQSGHPIPDERSLRAGQKAVEYVSALNSNDLLFCLLSGGGSALMTSPMAGVSLADMQELTTCLLACGARIEEINTLRRHLDEVKGGGLVKLTNGANIISLILSDVVGDRLEAIASGPTAPDPTTREQALDLIDLYELKNKIPGSILAGLKTAPETLKPGDRSFDTVQNVVIGSNMIAVQAALAQARLEGFHAAQYRTDIQGESREIGHELGTYLRQQSLELDLSQRPACIVVGGETTVTLHGKGKGGRNSELALAAVNELKNIDNLMLISLSTDGEDSSTDAAGAVVTGDTFQRATDLGMDGWKYLEQNNSYPYFDALDDLIRPGSTGTNVNDLIFMFVFK